MKLVGLFLALCMVLVVTSFSMLNAQKVSVHYLFGTTDFPLVGLLFIAVCVGMAFAFLLLCAPLFRNIWISRKLRTRLARAEEEAKLLKASDKVIS